MLMKCLTVGMIQANCYVVSCERTKKTAVIDPGGDGGKILDYIKSQGLDVICIINTHGHIDHIAANEEVRSETGAQVLIHELDAPMLVNSNENLSAYVGHQVSFKPADRLLHDGDEIKVGDIQFKVIHTPGHTRGGISLAAEGMVFTGDTLFNGSIGRTDFPGGSYETIIHSIQSKLMDLPDDTKVFPGHMEESTIGYERRHNPFLR